MTTTRDIALLRLAAQGLAGPGFDAPAEAVRWLTAVQAQDFPGGLRSVALRTRNATLTDVEAALDAGEVVRSWPMRGTLHFVPAADLGWMLLVTGEKSVRSQRTRRVRLGLGDDVLDRARELAVEALSGGRGLGRQEMLAAWQAGGIDTGDGRGYHLLLHLSQTGLLCLGPVAGREQRFVLLDEWVPKPRRLGREEALAEFALRFFRGHGPATVADLARWTKVTLTEARAGLAAVRGELEPLVVGDTEYFMDPRTPELLDRHRERARGVFLLPGFDEYMLGYADRTPSLPAEHADRIVPGGNGMFRRTVVAGGQVVGTWTSEKGGIVATPFTEFGEGVEDEVAKVYATLP